MQEVDPENVSDRALLDQTETMHRVGTIWSAILKADRHEIDEHIRNNRRILEERGPVGECPIHMLFLQGKPEHLKIATDLLTEYPQIVTQVYNGQIYFGENILHIAIVKRQIEMVRWLFQAKHLQAYRDDLLTARATGDFFKRGKPSYYGETPLGFACCTSQWDIVEILLENGADMDAIDSNGNNLLHVLVICNLQEIYAKFKKRWIDDHEEASAREQLWNQVNYENLTPLTLAADIGRTKMLLWLIEERKNVQWSYGDVTCVLHPLEQLDLDLNVQENNGRLSVLEVIIRNNSPALINPIIIALVEQKWKYFAYRILRQRFVYTFLYMITFLATTILEQMNFDAVDEGGEPQTISPELRTCHQAICLVGHLVVIAGALWKAAREIGEMLSIGARDYFGSSGSVFLENILSFSFCISILFARTLRLFAIEWEALVLAFASLLGWGYMLFFTMPFRFTGPFVIMISKMLFNDVLRFCIIYTVFLLGFSQSFFILFNSNGFFGYLSSVKHCFLGMLGDFDLDYYIDTPFPIATVTLLIFYVVLITILLLNLLIAMMGDTFADVKSTAKQLWHLERTRIALDIERNLSQTSRSLKRNRYWVDVEKQRYFQVEEVDNELFCKQSHGDDDEGEGD